MTPSDTASQKYVQKCGWRTACQTTKNFAGGGGGGGEEGGGIQKLEARWTKCVENKDDYVKMSCYRPTSVATRSVLGVGMLQLACWDCGFESRQGHGRLCLVNLGVVHVQATAMG
jgi:hypothetical protein